MRRKTMKKFKAILALLLAMVMVFALAACGSSSEDTAEDADSSADAEDTEAEDAESSSDETYVIGICQLVQHDALDAASEGFMDAITDALGEDSVTFDYQNASGDSATCATIVSGFVSEGYDLILANATAALQAAAAATTEIPILGTSITSYAEALSLDEFDGVIGGNISGTSDLAPLDQQAEMIQEIFPDAETVGLLYCTAEANSIYQVTVIAEYLAELGIETVEYGFADSNDIASVVTAACEEVDVIYIPTDNTAASCTDTIDAIALAAGIPIIAGEEGICSGCGVATLSISYYDLGYATGEMAVQILTGEADISTMEVGYAAEVTKEYDADRCEALGITIPDGYTAIESDDEE